MKSLRMPIVLLLTSCVILSLSADNYSSPVSSVAIADLHRDVCPEGGAGQGGSQGQESLRQVSQVRGQETQIIDVLEIKNFTLVTFIPIFQYNKYSTIPLGESVYAFPEPRVPEAEVSPTKC